MKIIELGSGRGGFARHIARELLKIDVLEKFVATNISIRENLYNQQKAKEEGLNADVYQVRHLSFDNLEGLDDCSFDVICSNEAILYSSDKSKLML